MTNLWKWWPKLMLAEMTNLCKRRLKLKLGGMTNHSKRWLIQEMTINCSNDKWSNAQREEYHHIWVIWHIRAVMDSMAMTSNATYCDTVPGQNLCSQQKTLPPNQTTLAHKPAADRMQNTSVFNALVTIRIIPKTNAVQHESPHSASHRFDA